MHKQYLASSPLAVSLALKLHNPFEYSKPHMNDSFWGSTKKTTSLHGSTVVLNLSPVTRSWSVGAPGGVGSGEGDGYVGNHSTL